MNGNQRDVTRLGSLEVFRCFQRFWDRPCSSYQGTKNRPPSGKDVVAPPPPDHPHHKGLQFGLCASDVNFREGDKAHEPSNSTAYHRPATNHEARTPASR